MEKKSKMKKTLSDYPRHDVSPFFKGLYQIKTRNKTVAIGRKQLGLFSTDTNEVLEDTAFVGIRKIVDRGEFIKIYKGTLFSILQVSKKAQAVFAYLLEAMKMNEHTIYFDAQECMEQTKYKSTRSVWEGLAELLEKDFIARSSKTHIYYINPEMAFNGDRLFQFHEWIKRDSEAHKRVIESENKELQTTIEFDNINENGTKIN